MAGSIPDVMPQTIYMDIMKYLADKDLKIVVDATKRSARKCITVSSVFN